MVGVIIVCVLSAGIVATTFALVPFTQDDAAARALNTVRTAAPPFTGHVSVIEQSQQFPVCDRRRKVVRDCDRGG